MDIQQEGLVKVPAGIRYTTVDPCQWSTNATTKIRKGVTFNLFDDKKKISSPSISSFRVLELRV